MNTIRKTAALSVNTIEAATYEALEAIGFEFKQQHRISNFVVDAFIPSLNLVVEVQGDFYHCNPTAYPNGPQYAVQHKTVERDKRRFSWLKREGYAVIQLWESDIKRVGASVLVQRALAEQRGLQGM